MGEATRLIRPRIVLDTNVLVSALLFSHRSLGWLVDAWQSGRTTPLVSAQTATELARVLGYPKFRLSEPEREDLLGEYLQPVDVPVCRDPNDRMFLQLSLSAAADALVTGDSDLLALDETLDIPVLTPIAFRSQLA